MFTPTTSNTFYRRSSHNYRGRYPFAFARLLLRLGLYAGLGAGLSAGLFICSLAFSANLYASSATPITGRWQESSFIGPEDGFTWHAVFYLTAIEQPQLITRHTGLMIRCTDADITDNLQVAFAFGSVLRTNSRSEVNVDIALDGKSRNSLKLVTRNHANAEFMEFGAKSFLQQLMSANTLQFSARLSPRGSSKVAMPLAPSRTQLNKMLKQCGINLATDVIAENSKHSKRQVAKSDVASTPLARAVSAYLAANNEAEIQTASQAIIGLDNSVAEVIKALGAENALSDEARKGLPGPGDEGVSMNEIDGLTLPFHVRVPTRTYIKRTADAGMPLAIVLHGGVRRPAWRDRERWWQAYPFDDLLREFLVVSPASWKDAFWWSDTQNRNLRQLIGQMQRHYRIDASRVFVIGISDGGAGALHLAMTDSTPLAGAVSLIGHPRALFDEKINTGAAPQLANLSQLPVFMVNGAKDNSMSLDTLEPWLHSLRALKVPLDSTIEPGMGHELFFSKSTDEKLETFLQTTRRRTDVLEFTWEAGTAQLPSRHRWLVIDKLKPGAQLGCVRAQKNANEEYVLSTEGVSSLRILTTHNQSKMRIKINPEGRRQTSTQVIELKPTPSVETLLKWHARDANRAQHYASEHPVTVESNTRNICQSPRGHRLVADATQRQNNERRRQQAAEQRSSISARGSSGEDSEADSAGGLPGGNDQPSRPRNDRPRGDPTRIKERRERADGILIPN